MAVGPVGAEPRKDGTRLTGAYAIGAGGGRGRGLV